MIKHDQDDQAASILPCSSVRVLVRRGVLLWSAVWVGSNGSKRALPCGRQLMVGQGYIVVEYSIVYRVRAG